MNITFKLLFTAVVLFFVACGFGALTVDNEKYQNIAKKTVAVLGFSSALTALVAIWLA